MDNLPSRYDNRGYKLGGVPKWTKGADCKSAIRGFESHRRLFIKFDNNMTYYFALPDVPLKVAVFARDLRGLRLADARQ